MKKKMKALFRHFKFVLVFFLFPFVLVMNPPKILELGAFYSRQNPHLLGKKKLAYIEPIFNDGVLEIEEEILEHGAKEWEDKVVGFFLDKKLPYSIVKTQVEKKWSLKGQLDISLDGDRFYFGFHNVEDRDYVLDEGYFHMMGKLFIIRKWTREIEDSRGSNFTESLSFLREEMHAQVRGSSSKPAIINTQDNRFAALANDTTAVEVQPSVARLGDYVSVVETEDNLFESTPVLENQHHHMYEALVDTSEDDYTRH
ncbi:hypothetical protein IFM89_006211 [Coptis chinensis]|uniref:DUF4283 domain-containing protein n=1 Tax=Coptis chinensis TaxID=261450 RepID=A0A835LID7_9MAGN|nr:hypothetical protein IFM89_006211 [Coptis chinensis]